MRACAAAAGMVVLLASGLGACGERAAGGSAPPRQLSVADLADVVIAQAEAPEGTEYVAGSSGPLTLDELWNPDCCPGQQQAFEDAGFRSAHGSLFLQPGHSGDPIDARPGVELLSSTAVLFATSAGASQALQDWYDYYRSPVFERLPTDGLAGDAIAVAGSPDAPAEAVFLYLWRIDRAVLALRVSAGRGTVDVERVRAWADRMHDRAT